MPQVVGAAILGAFGVGASTAGATILVAGVSTGLTLAGAVGGAALIAGSIAYSSSQNAKIRRAMSSANLDQGRSVMVRDPVAPRRLIYGQVLVSGTIVFIHTTGTKNEYLHLVIVLAGHEVEEIGDIYFNDEVVPLSSNMATGKYAGYARVNKKRGVPGDVADADLVAETGGVWTTDHKLSGCAYLNVRLKWSTELFPNGLPTIRAKVKGKKVYDPRTTTTVYSNNAALCAADYLMDSSFGKGVALARVPSADLIEAANICDEAIVLADASSEARYTNNGTINADQDPSEILRDLAGAMAGHIVDTGGTWTVRAGSYRSPTVTLTDDDLISSFSLQPRQSRQDTFNRVRGVFISPDNQWAPADFPAISNSTYKAADGGIWLDRDIQFNFTTSNATAQRLAKIELERGRQQITCTALFSLKALQVMPGDVVSITRSRLGWSAKEFEVIDWSFETTGDGENLGLGVRMTLRETASGVWDWADGEETEIDLAPNTTLPDPFTVPTPVLNLTSDGTTTVVQEDGTIVPRLLVEWDSPNDQFVESGGRIRVEYKKTADSDWTTWLEGRSDALLDYITDVVAGVSYDVRAQFVNVIGVRGAFCATATVSVNGDLVAPGVPTSLSATAQVEAIWVRWVNPSDDDFAAVRLWVNTTNNFGTASLVGDFAGTGHLYGGLAAGATRYFWAKSVDTSKNLSALANSGTAVSATATAAPTGATGATGATGSTGSTGPQGDTGPGLVYRGAYNSSTAYFHTSTRRDVVSSGGSFWLANNTGKSGLTTWGTPGVADWAAFGATFSSVATDLLLAQDVAILKTLVMGDGSTADAGIIRSNGASAFGTGTGFWLGYAGTTPKFRIGNPSGKFLSWDGSSLAMTVGSGSEQTVIADGKFLFGNPSGSQFYCDLVGSYIEAGVTGTGDFLFGNDSAGGYFSVKASGGAQMLGFEITSSKLKFTNDSNAAWYRSTTSTLKTDGNLVIGGDFTVPGANGVNHGIKYNGGNAIAFAWDGSNVRAVVDGSYQGTIPNP
jgi:hypothetical protein